MLKFVSKIFKPKPKEPKRKARLALKTGASEAPINAVTTIMPEDSIAGKGLFWGRYPHYPEMGTAYRSLFQRLKIDNQRSIMVSDPGCGSDMCSLASGSGPLIDYRCEDETADVVDRNIIKMGLGNKMDHVHAPNGPTANRQYFAHIMSFYPRLANDADLEWDQLGETIVPGGYVIISKIINANNNFKKPKTIRKNL